MTEGKDNRKVDFISYIAHEIRAPLASQRWYSEMLLDGTLGNVTDDQKKFLTEIYNSNRKIGELIDNLLEIVHTENGKYEIRPEQLDVVSVVKEIISKNENKLKDKKLELKTEFSSENISISFDKKSLELILDVLLSNAINYNKENGSINLNISSDENFLTIKVKDTGIGISNEDKDKIGVEMFRNARVKEMVPGTGLSLLLVKRVLGLTNGEIVFESKENEGSSFEIKLPIK